MSAVEKTFAALASAASVASVADVPSLLFFGECAWWCPSDPVATVFVVVARVVFALGLTTLAVALADG